MKDFTVFAAADTWIKSTRNKFTLGWDDLHICSQIDAYFHLETPVLLLPHHVH